MSSQSQDNITETFQEIVQVVGPEHARFDQKTIQIETENTLGLSKRVLGIVYPANTLEVQKIVNIANRYFLHLYPVSRGKNIGYGEKLPVGEDQIIIDLNRMNKIVNFNPIHGSASIEPGVTQGQLYRFLEENNAPFWLDVTGAGLDASIIGNTLEGGFGHTPKGNHRRKISNLEVVLGNGNILNTGTFPNLGPDLAGIFVQSNFGIVTKMDVEFMPIPQRFESFVIKVDNNDGLEPLVDALRQLRQKSTITGLIHIANATRTLMTTMKLPEEFQNKMIMCQDAQRVLTMPFISAGYWTAAGGIYGTKKEVNAAKSEISSKIRRIGKIMFFTDRKIKTLKRLANSRLCCHTDLGKGISRGMDAYEPVHQLMQGRPSDHPVNNIVWRVDDPKKMGLLWVAPSISANAKKVRDVVVLAEECYQEYGFEMPLTLTLVTPRRIVGVLSINFDKTINEQKAKAYDLYFALKKRFAEHEVDPYRMGVLGMDSIRYQNKGKNEVFRLLKKTLDPNDVIAPGRYGIE